VAHHEGKVAAMPVVSVMSVSNDPPRVAFASSPSHYTYKIVVASGWFSLCWLDSSLAGCVEQLGTKGGEGVPDKLLSVGLSHHLGHTMKVPVIDSASAVMECYVSGAEKLGDHYLVLGDVKAVYAVEDFTDYWTFKGYHPILYAGLSPTFTLYHG
jgi:flavin reductase (DIM6/NTAB) family NADH-FMN oxidoreductase RutF